MKAVLFSPLAENDLVEITLFIARNNPARALTFVAELEARYDALSEFPGVGAPRPELADGLRVVRHKNYLIFYREREDHIRIERVLQGTRDFGSLIGD
ncbi:MAG: type II toxin-antitoxin system RelE/ParE family toxin [Alphaproteobacteria bacterium]|nr:type II toxin-antitoxin system RelE/ParE family toxin [Alphaproteobacteria bacterium]